MFCNRAHLTQFSAHSSTTRVDLTFHPNHNQSFTDFIACFSFWRSCYLNHPILNNYIWVVDKDLHRTVSTCDEEHFEPCSPASGRMIDWMVLINIAQHMEFIALPGTSQDFSCPFSLLNGEHTVVLKYLKMFGKRQLDIVPSNFLLLPRKTCRVLVWRYCPTTHQL
jgi:hypothetical protein